MRVTPVAPHFIFATWCTKQIRQEMSNKTSRPSGKSQKTTTSFKINRGMLVRAMFWLMLEY